MTLARAMILAAGRGERMRPLTDRTPKPLLKVKGKPLIVWHLEALARAGHESVVINTAWMEDQIVDALGDGSRFGLEIHYSLEGRDHGGALETAGGIAKAHPLLADTFWIVSADVHVPQFAFDDEAMRRFEASRMLAHVWLVPNPPFHAKGDFGISADGLGVDGPGADGTRWTYANIALLTKGLCGGIAYGQHAQLAPLLFEGMRGRRITVETYGGEWHNLGTPGQLEAINAATAAK
jgi:MurNAc alpha-1-phosphate uridylyltransferase